MSIFSGISILLLLGFIGFFVVFPLSKRRPVLITESILALFVLLVLYLPLVYDPIVYGLVLIILVLRIFTKRVWVLYGVDFASIESALERAAKATRASLEEQGGKYNVNEEAQFSVFMIGNRLSLLGAAGKTSSKRVVLAREVFRKFLLNYFVSGQE